MAGRAVMNQPKRADVRQARRRERMAQRLAAAATPSERIGAAADHLRAALAHVPPAKAEQISEEIVRALLAATERAYREEARA